MVVGLNLTREGGTWVKRGGFEPTATVASSTPRMTNALCVFRTSGLRLTPNTTAFYIY